MESHNLSVVDVSQILLSLSEDRVEDWMTPLKLQKLLYYSQAVSLVMTWKSLFLADIQAWAHWPVVPEIFQKYKPYGSLIITDVELEYELPTDWVINEIFTFTWEMYSWYTAKWLEKLTHEEYPWIEARWGLPPLATSNNVISLESMITYYSIN